MGTDFFFAKIYIDNVTLLLGQDVTVNGFQEVFTLEIG